MHFKHALTQKEVNYLNQLNSSILWFYNANEGLARVIYQFLKAIKYPDYYSYQWTDESEIELNDFLFNHLADSFFEDKKIIFIQLETQKKINEALKIIQQFKSKTVIIIYTPKLTALTDLTLPNDTTQLNLMIDTSLRKKEVIQAFIAHYESTSIASELIHYFNEVIVEQLPSDRLLLQQELTKITYYCFNAESIDTSKLNQLRYQTIQFSEFNLIEAILTGNSKKTIQLLSTETLDPIGFVRLLLYVWKQIMAVKLKQNGLFYQPHLKQLINQPHYSFELVQAIGEYSLTLETLCKQQTLHTREQFNNALIKLALFVQVNLQKGHKPTSV